MYKTIYFNLFEKTRRPKIRLKRPKQKYNLFIFKRKSEFKSFKKPSGLKFNEIKNYKHNNRLTVSVLVTFLRTLYKF